MRLQCPETTQDTAEEQAECGYASVSPNDNHQWSEGWNL